MTKALKLHGIDHDLEENAVVGFSFIGIEGYYQYLISVSLIQEGEFCLCNIFEIEEGMDFSLPNGTIIEAALWQIKMVSTIQVYCKYYFPAIHHRNSEYFKQCYHEEGVSEIMSLALAMDFGLSKSIEVAKIKVL